MHIIFYQKANGREPVRENIAALEKRDQAEILGCLASVEQHGIQTNRCDFRQIGGKLWEIKLRTPSGGYRIFYVMLGQDTMVLLHSYRKQTQKAPKQEIETAIKRMQEILFNN